MAFDRKQFGKILDRDDVAGLVDKLAEQINRDYSMNDRILLVGVLKGAFIIMADLIRKLHSNVDVEFVRLSSAGGSSGGKGTIYFVKDLNVDVKNRHVIIVEEIIDSGRTLEFLCGRIRSARPLSLKVATLLDKKSKRVVKSNADYVGMELDDQFLIGYGLDLEEECRNLPEIYSLKYPN